MCATHDSIRVIVLESELTFLAARVDIGGVLVMSKELVLLCVSQAARMAYVRRTMLLEVFFQ